MAGFSATNISSMTQPRRLGSLIGLTGRQWRRAVNFRLQRFDLTEATWVPLLQLARSEKPLRQKDLAAMLSLDSSSVVRVLKTLEAAGLVERGQDGDDGRAKALIITEAGRALAERVEHVSRDLEREVLVAIPGPDIAVARRVLEKISGHLDQLNDTDAAA
jgi:MarR family transcriptional regulator for hemolysin